MLPAWATVSIAAISALAGIIGGVLVTVIRNRSEQRENEATRRHEREQQEARLAHERTEQWSERLVRAADDFSTGVEQTILGLRDVFTAIGDEGDVDAARAEAKRRLHETVARLARIKLLFGEDAEAVTIARDILGELDYVHRATQEADDPTLAWQHLEKVYGLHASFHAAAFEMISSPRWRVGRDVKLTSRGAGTAAEGDA